MNGEKSMKNQLELRRNESTKSELKGTELSVDGDTSGRGVDDSSQSEKDKNITCLGERMELSTSGKVEQPVTFSDTRIDIKESADKFVDVRLNNPAITYSKPVSSPTSKALPETRECCPLYNCIKSYIQEFYQLLDKDLLKSREKKQEDDFHFIVEPVKRPRRGFWVRSMLWVGISIMLLGIIAMLVGHFIKPRETVMRQYDNFTVSDYWVVTFNNRLVICQLGGLMVFAVGAVTVTLALLVSRYQQDQTRLYYVMATTVVPEIFKGNPLAIPSHGLNANQPPLSRAVHGVQPVFRNNL